MRCGLAELRCKEVINLNDGACLGCVDDLLVDTCDQKVVAMVVYGRARWFGLMGRDEDIIINWDKIEMIGCDAILVKMEPHGSPKKHKWYQEFFK